MIFMTDSEAPVLRGKVHTHNASQSNDSNPASSVTSVGPDSRDSTHSSHSTHSRQRDVERVLDIDQTRSDLLELVDQYDVIAHELRRMHIPLKKSWETHHALATSRLDKMVQLHERASAERLSLDLGECKLSAAQFRRLNTEVDSLAAARRHYYPLTGVYQRRLVSTLLINVSS